MGRLITSLILSLWFISCVVRQEVRTECLPCCDSNIAEIRKKDSIDKVRRYQQESILRDVNRKKDSVWLEINKHYKLLRVNIANQRRLIRKIHLVDKKIISILARAKERVLWVRKQPRIPSLSESLVKELIENTES